LIANLLYDGAATAEYVEFVFKLTALRSVSK